MGDWLVLSVFLSPLLEKENVLHEMSKPSLHTHNLGQVQAQEPEQPTTKQRQRRCRKVTFAKRKRKKKEVGGWGGEGVIPWNENTNAPSRVHIYKLIENINIIVFGTKSKHQEELNSDIA